MAARKQAAPKEGPYVAHVKSRAARATAEPKAWTATERPPVGFCRRSVDGKYHGAEIESAHRAKGWTWCEPCVGENARAKRATAKLPAPKAENAKATKPAKAKSAPRPPRKPIARVPFAEHQTAMVQLVTRDD